MIWLLEYGEELAERTLAPLLPLLDADFRERLPRFRREKSRVETALTWLLLRCAYEREYGGRPPETVRGERGKPAFAEPGAPQFNLSHCRGVSACALSRFPVGVDVQPLTLYAPKFCRIFSEPERIWVEQEDPDRRFTELWTRKEAYGKALGCGIAYEMSQTDLSGDFSARRAVGGWLLQTLPTASGSLSVCSREDMELQNVSLDALFASAEELLAEGGTR